MKLSRITELGNYFSPMYVRALNSGCQEPRDTSNSSGAHSNFCKESKDALFSIQHTFR